MYFMVVLILCCLLAILSYEHGRTKKQRAASPSLLVKHPPQEAKQEVPPPQKKELSLRPIWVEVQPAPLKVIGFVEGKAEGQLVMHGPYNGVVKRLLLLSKVGKEVTRCKCIKLDALYGIQSQSIDGVYASTLEEARKIAQAVYGKKKRPKTAAPAEQAQQQPRAVLPPVPVVAAPEQTTQQTPSLPAQSEAPEPRAQIHGFLNQYVGKLISARFEEHTKVEGGVPVQFKSFTVTLETAAGPERILGNDLKRAIADSNAKAGDSIRVIHVKDTKSGSGFRTKSFEVANLSRHVG